MDTPRTSKNKHDFYECEDCKKSFHINDLSAIFDIYEDTLCVQCSNIRFKNLGYTVV